MKSDLFVPKKINELIIVTNKITLKERYGLLGCTLIISHLITIKYINILEIFKNIVVIAVNVSALSSPLKFSFTDKKKRMKEPMV